MPRKVKKFHDLPINERKSTYFGIWIGILSTFVANAIWDYPIENGPLATTLHGYNTYQLGLLAIGIYFIYRLSKDAKL